MAEGDDDSEKTEEPTAKRLEDAREKGQVPNSREVSHVFMIFAALMLLVIFAPRIGESLAQDFHQIFSQAHLIPMDEKGIGNALKEMILDVLKIMALPLLVLMVAAISSNVVQTGFLVSAESMKPKLEKLSLLKGFKRQFSLKSFVEFLKGLLKLAIVGSIAYMIVAPKLDGIEHFAGLPVPMVLEETQSIAMRMMIGVLMVVAVIAGADFLYQRFEFMKQMRMSRQDIKDEYKQTEGDPMVKGKLRQIRAEKSRQRMMQSVPNADVIVTNPTHYSIALQYDADEMHAPKVVAKGVDNMAFKIREIAKENDIPIMEAPPLARALYATVDVDQEITEEHYKAVAEVISYVFSLKGKKMS